GWFCSVSWREPNSSPGPVVASASSRDRDTDQLAHTKGYAGGGEADKHLPQSREPHTEPREQGGAGANQEQCDPARGEARDDRRQARQKKVRGDRKDRADREQEERGSRGGPGRAAEFVGVNPQLLSNERVERGSLVANQALRKGLCLIFG